MRKMFLSALAAVAMFAGSSPAQDCCGESQARLYGSVDALYYWIKDAPNEFPLLVTGPQASRGLLDQPGIVPLFGGRDVDYEGLWGGRVTLGFWLNDCRTVGVEASGFYLEEGEENVAARGNAAGNPLLAFAFIDAADGRPNSLLISAAAAPPLSAIVGGATASSRAEIWGAEANLVVNLGRGCHASLDALIGARYLDLDEDITLTGQGAFSIPGTAPQALAVGTATFSFFDQFATENQFYGGQIGARFRCKMDKLSLGLTAKGAFGWNDQEINVRGAARTAGTGALAQFFPATRPGGLYTGPGNLGTRNNDEFSMVGEAIAEVGYQVTCHLKVTAGYNFLYWTDVVRPGDAIDPVLNSTASNFGRGPQVGPARPVARSQNDDFWMHGAHVGIALNY